MDMELLGYCGVDCSVCADFLAKKCPSCRKSTWEAGDECPPVACCTGRKADCCGRCAVFPCEMMAGFYRESESHQAAYERMKQLRANLHDA